MAEPISIKERQTGSPAKYLLSKGGTDLWISEEGGMISELIHQKKRIFFPDQKVMIGGKEKRRGGMPILFPQAGPAPEGSTLPQHGFAREVNWVRRDGKFEPDAIGLDLKVKDRPIENFPHLFTARLSVNCTKDGLGYGFFVENEGDEEMPIAPGLHPYFNVPRGKIEEIKTNIPGFDPTTYELGKFLVFPTQKSIELVIPEVEKIVMDLKGDLGRKQAKILVWSDDPRYLCVEPWTADVMALGDPDKRINLPPGKASWSYLTVKIEQ
ncbi:hypothetical protein HY502_00720 [Candidatus Woesebacteria bacterium]|nr:hypothetical protein [Candidatus Woesebacteria bacterium]